jgi:hypothetical protein
MDWIKTKQMLPPFEKEVLVVNGQGYVTTGHLSTGYTAGGKEIGWVLYTPQEKPGCWKNADLFEIEWWQEFYGRPQGSRWGFEIADAVVSNLGKTYMPEGKDDSEEE